MPTDAAHPLQPGSPFNVEENLGKRDKNFRRYSSGVERALSLFDTALQEWADYISFLGRLMKALQAKPSQCQEIPHGRLVSKRLSQCLNSNLPSGVHQKALEVYTVVFSTLGNHGLSAELSLYLPGLSPLLSFASLTVRPLLLCLFEKFILVLDIEALKPALKAIIMSLLLGLEEPSSEDFERTQLLLNNFRKVVNYGTTGEGSSQDTHDDRFFWQSFFMASISNVSRRQGALAYLERNLPPLIYEVREDTNDASKHSARSNGGSSQNSTSIEAVTSPEPGLLVRSFAAGLQDGQLLVQRGFLELLVTHLPLSSTVLQHRVSAHDLQRLVIAATSVVIRREMSLNRRLWLWFLGKEGSGVEDQSEPSSPQSDILPPTMKSGKASSIQYFERHGLNALEQGLLRAFDSNSQSAAQRAKPLRICLSLMDRWEIGGLVLPRVFKPAMTSVHNYEAQAHSKDAFSEVLRSANAFFDAVQSDLIWKEIIGLIFEALGNNDSDGVAVYASGVDKQLQLVWFIITKFNIREEDMLEVHIPHCLMLLLHFAQRASTRGHSMKYEDLEATLDTILKTLLYLVDQLPNHAYIHRQSSFSPPHASTKSSSRTDIDQSIPRYIRGYYQNIGQISRDECSPYSYQTILSTLVSGSISLATACVSDPVLVTQLSNVLSLSTKLLSKISETQDFEWGNLLTTLNRITSSKTGHFAADFDGVLGHVSTLELISLAKMDHWHADFQVRKVMRNVTWSLWMHLSMEKPRYNVEAVRCLWRLQYISPDDDMLESAVTSFVCQDDEGLGGQQSAIEGLQRFFVLWTHTVAMTRISQKRLRSFQKSELTSHKTIDKTVDELEALRRPLLLVLDALKDSHSERYYSTSNWLKSNSSTNVILDVLISSLHTDPYLSLLRNDMGSLDKGYNGEGRGKTQEAQHLIYYLQTTSNVVACSSMQVLSASAISSVTTQQGENNQKNEIGQPTIQQSLIQVCTSLLQNTLVLPSDTAENDTLRQLCVTLLKQITIMSDAEFVAVVQLEPLLVKCLAWSIEWGKADLQITLMETLTATLAKRPISVEATPILQPVSRSSVDLRADHQISMEYSVNETPKLLECLISGLKSPESYSVLEQWILLPLADCLSAGITALFEGLESTFAGIVPTFVAKGEPIQSLNLLFNALELILAKGHDQISRDEAKKLRLPEPSQGYFGNMVTGLFTAEAQAPRHVTANDRLSVLLCFRDAVKISSRIWAWEAHSRKSVTSHGNTSATFNYTSVRLRNRTKKVLENLFSAEPLECLEVVVELWTDFSDNNMTTVMDLLRTLDATRPKNAMPAIFNALYSRTNPTVLDPFRQSTLTSDLSEVQLATFLNSYTRSMEDDALDEVWTDCMTFSKDVLANPMPQRQILSLLLEFIAVLGEKIDNTNFGEQRRMRREIGDLFSRLLAASFTIKPLSFTNDISRPSFDTQVATEKVKAEAPTDIVAILSSVLPGMIKILIDTDRISAVASTISVHILMPTFHWKGFPHNVRPGTLRIMQTMSRVTEASRTWKKDVAEAFNDSRFFHTRPLSLVENGWMPILRQWTLTDKERMPDIVARLTAPTTAGIVFGVGASSARLEADRKAQLNLRRIALLILSTEDDTSVPYMKLIQERLADLLNATASSSPSSATRAEVYMVFRTLVLKTTPVHLTSLWPVINSELHEALASIGQIASRETYNITSILQAAKLLDTLILVGPDDFQLREWLYITDTIDAVYRPPSWKPVALVDELAAILDSEASVIHSAAGHVGHDASNKGITPLLRWEDTHGVPREKLLDHVLRPFLRNLSINAFESMYGMETVDKKACCEEVLKDLFDDSTLV